MAQILLCDYKDELKNAYGYSEEMAENISIMADSMATTYGEEYRDLIYKAIKSCKFDTAKNKKNGIMETVEEILKSNGIENFDNRDLKSVTVAYGMSPNIAKEGSSYAITGITRVMALSPRFNWQNPDSLNNLAVETDRLINNYLNGFEIEGNELTIREGLSTRTMTLKGPKDAVIMTPKSVVGVGLETGLSLYMAQKVIRENYSPTYDATGFDYERLSAGYLYDSLEFDRLITTARMTKDKTELVSAIDSVSPSEYSLLIEALDHLDALEKERIETLGNNDMLAEASNNLDIYFQNGIAPTTNEMSRNMGKSEDIQNVIKR